MNLLRLFGLVVVLAIAAALTTVPASAFQETQITPDATKTGDAPEKAQSNTLKNADAVELTAPDAGEKSSDGMEISLPGVGTIGKLPKLDFGLELLYGANAQSDATAHASEDDPTDSEVMIRGTVKKRF